MLGLRATNSRLPWAQDGGFLGRETVGGKTGQVPGNRVGGPPPGGSGEGVACGDGAQPASGRKDILGLWVKPPPKQGGAGVGVEAPTL